jgi:hypothetical protein
MVVVILNYVKRCAPAIAGNPDSYASSEGLQFFHEIIIVDGLICNFVLINNCNCVSVCEIYNFNF